MECFSFPNILQLIMCQIFIFDRLQRTSGLITLTQNSTLTDPWTFQEGDNVTLTCIIQPYNNFQIWRFNSSSVSSCGLVSCGVTNNKNGNFIFQQNAGVGEFFWHIIPMQLEYDNSDFECSDGTPAGTLSYTAKVRKRLTRQGPTTDSSSNVGAIVGGSVGGFVGVIGITLLGLKLYYYCRKGKTNRVEFTTTDPVQVEQKSPGFPQKVHTTRDLPMLEMDAKEVGRSFAIRFRLEKDNSDVLTTVCLYTNGTVPGTKQKGTLPLPLHDFKTSMVTYSEFHLITNKNTTCKTLEFGIGHVFKVEKTSEKTEVNVFVFWTTKDNKVVANSGLKDFTTDINSKKEFSTKIGPKRRPRKDNKTTYL